MSTHTKHTTAEAGRTGQTQQGRPRRVRATLVPAATALALALGACTAGGNATPASSTAGASGGRASTVVFAFTNQVNTLDPLNSDYAQTNYIDAALYDTLVTYDDKGEIVGALAKQFALSKDARSVSITLRDGVTFHDGTALTAKDVAYTLDRYAALGQGVAGLLSGYKSTTVTDDTHLTIQLTAPNSLFLGALSKAYILNSALVTAHAGSDKGQAWLQAHDAGSGPFTASGQPLSQQIAVKRYGSYYDFDPKRPTSLVFRRIDESATKRDELKAGNVDVALGLSATDIASLAGSGNVAVSDLRTASQAYVFFNMLTGPTANPVVRRAVQLAYDYSGGLAKIRGGKGEIADGPLQTTMPCRPAAPKYAQNLAQAKQLLQQAGIKNLTLTMRFQPVFAEQAQEATLLQSNLRDIGVTLKLVPIAFPDYLASLSDWKKIPQMMLLTDFAQFPDPGVVLSKTYESTAKGTNRAGYANPKVDKLLDQALATGDPTARCDLYKQAQTIIRDDAASVSMYTLFEQVAFRKGLTGVVHSATVSPVSPASIRLP